jgi:hypothetical protein
MTKLRKDDLELDGDKELADEIRRVSAELFDASEKLYHLAIKRQKLRKLPKDAERPEAIAFEVAMRALRHNLACPEWAARAVSQRWQEFEAFKYESLGEAFGIQNPKQRHAQQDKLLCSTIYRSVRALQDQGIPLKDSAKGDGALTTVGKKFRMSGKKVEQLMKLWRDLCRETGSDPDAEPVYGDARKLIAAAIAGALRPTS